MAELSISPDVIRDALKDFVAAYEPTGAAATEVGTVVDAADGIAHLEGLPGVMANELVTFADGTSGLALNLDEHEVGVVVLGEFSGIEAGQEVRRTGEVLSVAVGDGYLGRVVDPKVIGGVRVQIADDVIDASVSSRISDLRKRLAG